MRYAQLNPVVAKVKPRTIVEIGTNHHRGVDICAEALNWDEELHYIGIGEEQPELFESLKVKYPKFVCEFNKDWEKADFVFFDCARPSDEVHKVYEQIKDNTGAIFFDGVFHSKDDFPGDEFGANTLLKDMENTVLLPATDPWKNGSKIQSAVWPRSAFPGKINLVIKTRNCVPDEEILENIKYAVPKMPKWIKEAALHDMPAVFASGGPSLKEHLDDIREWEKKGAKVFCVKHAHDLLIENGIIPFGCILLDPRNHVQDFIENPHPEVLYFTATMVHPSTLDRLIEKKANIIGYNAAVGSGEEKVLGSFGKHIMIGGGSTSATRGISIIYALGFRQFHLYGYDSCYYEPQDTSEKTKLGHQKYYEAEVSGKKFWTDSELMAQAQDFEKLMKEDKDIDIQVYGDGMIPHIWTLMRRIRPSFEDVVNG
jgi:hypothetical protein